VHSGLDSPSNPLPLGIPSKRPGRRGVVPICEQPHCSFHGPFSFPFCIPSSGSTGSSGHVALPGGLHADMGGLPRTTPGTMSSILSPQFAPAVAATLVEEVQFPGKCVIVGSALIAPPNWKLGGGVWQQFGQHPSVEAPPTLTSLAAKPAGPVVSLPCYHIRRASIRWIESPCIFNAV
jgi:hypothetical protein